MKSADPQGHSTHVDPRGRAYTSAHGGPLLRWKSRGFVFHWCAWATA